MARLNRENLGDVTTDEDAQRIKDRRERGGWKKSEVADRAGVHRNTYAAIEAGSSYNRSTLRKIENALDDLEEEAGIGAPPAAENAAGGLMEIRAEGVFGIKSIVVNGPVSDRDELVETIAKLIERVERSHKDNPPETGL